MKNLLLNAKMIELTDECLLILSKTQNKWFMTSIKNKAAFEMMDGTHSSDEVFSNSVFQSKEEFLDLIATLSELDMIGSNSYKCSNETCSGSGCQKKYPNHVVMNLTDQCNLNCLYCYVDSSPLCSNYMKPDVAVKIASELISLNADNDKKITFVFHGGEPTLNLDTIRAFCEYVVPYRDRVCLSLQTNGTNITDEFIELVKKYSISVGLSMDGYKELHDATRVDINGKGSFARVEKGIERLREENISFGLLTVLNRNNYKHTREILDYFSSIGAHNCAFLRLTEIGRESAHPELLITGDEVYESFCNIIDWLIEYNSTHEIAFEERTISKMVKIISGGERDYMCMRKPCGAGRDTIGVDTKGNVYPCDDMVGVSELHMGNLMETDLKSMVDNTKVLDIIDASGRKMKEECAECIWKNLCSEVCSSQYYSSSHETVLEEPECQFHQKLIPELLRRYYNDPSVFELLCSELKQRPNKNFYFNITYVCNSHCIFCAADHDINPVNNVITADMMNDLIQFHNMEAGDNVVLNGGEPTMNPELAEIISLFSEKNIHTIVYSNGRKLSDRQFCKKLIESGLNRISIPLFGYDAETHDHCTGVTGAFDETVSGIRNILELRKELNSSITIEIKLLYIRCLLDTNPEIVSWLAENFPYVDNISVNSLIVSDTVLMNQEELLPDFETWSYSLNKTLLTAKETGVIDKIKLNDTPYCLISNENYDFLERYIAINGDDLKQKERTYIDYNTLNGKINDSVIIEDDDPCNECVMHQECKFINRTYGDSKVAAASLSLLS